MKIFHLAVPFLIAGCNVDHTAVEDSIRTELKSKGVELKSVTCPGDVKMKSGGTFECKGEDWQGTAFTVNVTLKDSTGSLEWKVAGMIYDPQKGSSAVKEKIGKDIDCGSKAFIAIKGTKMECKSDGKTATITFIDDDGKMDDGFDKLF